MALLGEAVVLQASRVADAALSSCGDMELELRLGQVVDGRFVPGVNPEWFETITNRMRRFASWDRVDEWVEMEDATFDVGDRSIRQRRLTDPRTCGVRLETIEKSQVCHEDIVLAPQGDTRVLSQLIASDVTAIRISCAREKPVDCTKLPFSVKPTYVRVQQRLGFLVNSSTVRGAAWYFQCSRTWVTDTHESAVTVQSTQQATCEIEVEWIPPTDLGVEFDATDVAVALLSKADSLLYT